MGGLSEVLLCSALPSFQCRAPPFSRSHFGRQPVCGSIVFPICAGESGREPGGLRLFLPSSSSFPCSGLFEPHTSVCWVAIAGGSSRLLTNSVGESAWTRRTLPSRLRSAGHYTPAWGFTEFGLLTRWRQG